jgi:hypothetical protein
MSGVDAAGLGDDAQNSLKSAAMSFSYSRELEADTETSKATCWDRNRDRYYSKWELAELYNLVRVERRKEQELAITKGLRSGQSFWLPHVFVFMIFLQTSRILTGVFLFWAATRVLLLFRS